MNGPGLFTTHVPGTSWLHRAPLWLKLTGVVLVGTTTFWFTSWWQAALLLVALLAVGLGAGLPTRRVVASLRALGPVLVLLGAFHWWTQGLPEATRIVVGIANAYLAAGLLTATTPVTDMLDGLVRGAKPLRRWLDPEVVALTLGIMLRSVPWVAGAFGQVRVSARARGLERSPRALVLPVVIHTVAYARRTGEALAARGLTDPPTDD
ncbi:cobalt transporter [Intrasporangium oryzae NRRL B-24470]|uniref:Cobalt transporter n=1 Tax=Intrasporangium oryzae NRRL B-24470 TaxID=1386089 RepID=W9G5B9_9MICO|nr:energy-coupling factor transporter transmembrane protein EcfT [Intrasporangium oryzae]EWT00487.1 cobalt transporter [Intrasporangium oryzae NRRL B-24470]